MRQYRGFGGRKLVARYQGQPEAEMWAELLRNAGIPTVVIRFCRVLGWRGAWCLRTACAEH